MRWLSLALLVLLPAATLVRAEERLFRKEVRQIVGSAQSLDDARLAAIARAKRDALEEAGTWVESITEVKNMKLVRDDIISLSSGITRTRIIEEEPFLEGRAVGIRILCEVGVDNAGLAERAKLFLADRERVANKRIEIARERELLDRIADLERRMAATGTGDAKQIDALRIEVKENSRKLAAQEAYKKGEALWVVGKEFKFSDPHAAIAAFSEAIRLDPGWALAWSRRGRAYTDLREYDLALQDANVALRLDPSLAWGYIYRARNYLERGNFSAMFADAEKAVQLDPDNPAGYFLRGVADSWLSFRARGKVDITKACSMEFEIACNLLKSGKGPRG